MINPFKKKFTKTEHDIFLFLAKMPLFADLNYKQMAHFIPFMHERSYEKDEVVFFRNDPSQALYLIRKGEVGITIDTGESFENLNTIKAGASLGESSLLNKVKRELNAVVVSDTADFYVIPQENIFSIFEDHIKIKAKMMEALARKYNDYNSKLFKAYRSSSGFFDLQQIYNKD